MTAPTIIRSNTHRENRNAMQQRADSAIADHPYRLELSGSLRSLAWPSICANCGESAAERLTVRKVFRRPRVHGRRRRGMIRHTVTAAEIPYCPGCVARHRALTPRQGVAGQALGVLLTPLLIPIVGSVIFGVISLRAVLGISPSEPYARYAWGLPGLFLFSCIWSIIAAWKMTQRERVEPQSDVTFACDFSDDVSRFLERERRIYALRNQTFADAFANANRDRVWTAEDDKRSARQSLAVLAVAGVVGVVVWAWVVLGPQ